MWIFLHRKRTKRNTELKFRTSALPSRANRAGVKKRRRRIVEKREVGPDPRSRWVGSSRSRVRQYRRVGVLSTAARSLRDFLCRMTTVFIGAKSRGFRARAIG